jgi:hypothetical protein
MLQRQILCGTGFLLRDGRLLWRRHPSGIAGYRRWIQQDTAHSDQHEVRVLVCRYLSDVHERSMPGVLFEDTMRSVNGLLVADPAGANALRLSMRLLEDAAEAAHVVGALLERPDGGAAMDRLSSESG